MVVRLKYFNPAYRQAAAENAERKSQNMQSRSMKDLCGYLPQRPLRLFAFTIFVDRKKVRNCRVVRLKDLATEYRRETSVEAAGFS